MSSSSIPGAWLSTKPNVPFRVCALARNALCYAELIMPAPIQATRALAIDLRDAASGALLAVALVVPSEKYASILSNGAATIVEPRLADVLWDDFETWVSLGDAGLPSRPAPLGREVVDALFAHQPSSVIAERSASIPLPAAPGSALAPFAQRILPELLATH